MTKTISDLSNYEVIRFIDFMVDKLKTNRFVLSKNPDDKDIRGLINFYNINLHAYRKEACERGIVNWSKANHD